jgi:Tfp pilus assembly protein PilW
MNNFYSSKNKTGFSLLEAIVGIFISLLILIAVYAVFTFSIQNKPKIENRAEIIQNERVVIDRISRELRQATKIITILPANELLFADGHGNLNNIPLQYLRYHLVGSDLYREARYYYFSSDPNTHVKYNDTDNNGNLPSINITENRIIGQYISSLNFNGTNLNINIAITFQLGDEGISISTYVSPRNLD